MKNAIAVKCLISYNTKYLLLCKTNEESREDLSNNSYDIPGGRVEYGEELKSALVREIKEETGLIISESNLDIVDATSIIRPDKLNLVIITYKTISLTKNVKLSEEHNYYCWLSKEEIIMSDCIPDWIKSLIKKC